MLGKATNKGRHALRGGMAQACSLELEVKVEIAVIRGSIQTCTLPKERLLLPPFVNSSPLFRIFSQKGNEKTVGFVNRARNLSVECL